MVPFNLQGKKAIVTGGGSGIGREVSKALSKNGAHVAILDINKKQGESVVEEVENLGGNAKFISCDVSDYEGVNEAIHSSFDGSSIDILVNNAGIAHVGNIEDTSTTDLEKLFDVNVKGVYNGMKAVVGLMKENGGSIINLSSIAAHVGIDNRFAYSMSKGAVHAITLSVAKDYISYNIRCNSISPARVHTPFVDDFVKKNFPAEEKPTMERLAKSQPIGRMGQPDEIGALVLYLCSDEASFITGSDFPIDGGFVTLNS